MKTLIHSGFFVLTLSLGLAFSGENKVGVNIAGTGQLPVGNMADVTGMGLGGLGGIEVGMYPGLALTARSGFIYHFDKSDNFLTYTFRQIPVLGGGKFTIPNAPLYIAGEMGVIFVRKEIGSTILTPKFTSNTSNFGWDAGIGSVVGPTDIRLTFNVLDASDMDNSMTLGLVVGFTLWSI